MRYWVDAWGRAYRANSDLTIVERCTEDFTNWTSPIYSSIELRKAFPIFIETSNYIEYTEEEYNSLLMLQELNK